MKKMFQMKGITNLLHPPIAHPYVNTDDKYIGENYCLFLDYDGIDEHGVMKDIKKLTDRFKNIPTVWVIKTKRDHFWVLSFGIFKRSEVLDMMYCSNCDHEYFKAFKIYGMNTIRISRKKDDASMLELVAMIQRRTLREVSLQHTNLFENTFKKKDLANATRRDCGMQYVDYWVEA
jgi:hypothetical protein